MFFRTVLFLSRYFYNTHCDVPGAISLFMYNNLQLVKNQLKLTKKLKRVFECVMIVTIIYTFFYS